MNAVLQEWLNTTIRWAHVIAAIMWIGDSFLFMWLDRQLRAAPDRSGDVVGELWMAHSGGFYEVVKRRSLERLPPELHFFKWESYGTWITGVMLLVVVYFMGGSALLRDPHSPLSASSAIAVATAVLPTAAVVYVLLCRTPLLRAGVAFAVVAIALIMALTYGLGLVLSARAAFLLTGAAVGTVMTSNVFFVIIPAQKEMLAATRENRPVDTSYGNRAKHRSTHNHYATLPVLLLMLSNHFPSLYGHRHAWLVVGLLFVLGIGVKVAMNERRKTPIPVLVAAVAALGTVGWMTRPIPLSIDPALAAGEPVSFATVHTIVQTRCVACHAAEPTNPAFPQAPQGVMLDNPERIEAYVDRIFLRVVHTETMPLGNITGITPEERKLLGAWIAQGANVSAPGPVQIETGPPKKSKLRGPELAAQLFEERCAPCHGKGGRGDGPSAVSLNPKPRNYTDPDWQQTVSDDRIARAIILGGKSVGLSEMMPGNPDLAAEPEVVEELIQIIRGFGRER